MSGHSLENEKTDPPNVTRSVVMFIITTCSVYLVYGFQWANGNPLQDVGVAWESAQFAMALMTILLCHELGHYFVAKHHGFELSVPYFLPFPFAFGTLGAVIHLKSLPKSRTALLEMGAAGPIAGFIVTVMCILIDAPNTVNNSTIEMIGSYEEYAQQVLALPKETGVWSLINTWLGYEPPSLDTMSVLIMEDPLLMRIGHMSVLSEPLSSFAQLGPIAFAGWVGCLITSINLLPIGQLDGGHILNALFPSKAKKISKGVLGMVFVYGLLTWKGWMVWATLLWFMKATEPVWVPAQTTLSIRALVVSVVTVCVFILCLMLEPIYSETISIQDIVWILQE